MRLRPILILLSVPVALAGCGGSAGTTPGGALNPEQEAARLKLVEANNGLNDVELAHLCPMLYPKDVQAAVAVDFTGNTAAQKKAKDALKKYRFETQKVRIKKFSAAQLAQAKLANCGATIPFPVAAPSTKAK